MKTDRHQSCVSRASTTCVYLKDGTKVVLRRDPKTKGRAWLEHVPQAVVRLAEPAPAGKFDALFAWKLTWGMPDEVVGSDLVYALTVETPRRPSTWIPDHLGASLTAFRHLRTDARHRVCNEYVRRMLTPASSPTAKTRKGAR